MPRTEKKFGQINAGTVSSIQTAVASSANRKNVLLNLTTNASETINVITTTGNLAFPTITATVSGATSNATLSGSTATATVRGPFYFNAAGTKLVTSPGGTNSGSDTRRLSISATSATVTATLIGTTTVATGSGVGLSQGFTTGNVSTIETSPTQTTYQDTIIYTSPIKWTANDKVAAMNPANKDFYDTAFGASNYRGGTILNFDAGTTVGHANAYWPAFTVSAQSYSGNDSTQTVKTMQVLGNDVVFGVGSLSQAVVSSVSGSNRFWIYSYPDSAASLGTISGGAIGVSATSAGLSQQDLIANFCFVDYNPTYSVYVCPSATSALSDSTFYWKTSGGSTGTAITSSAAGFRIIDNSKYSVDFGLAYLTGGYTYPVAPTGVTVPTSVRPIASVKFSPNGKYLAVAYNRDYSGTGNTNSVVVLYERQTNGSWTHYASSGSSIAFRPQNFDAMAWTPDGAGVMVHSGTNVYVWFAGISTKLKTYSTFTYASGKPDLYNLEVPYTGSTTISVTGSSVGPTFATFPAVTGGQLIQVYPQGFNAGSALENVASTAHGQRIFLTTAGAASVTNYVNTVVQNLTVGTNQVVQISNIVLEAGERLDMEFLTGSRLNAVAYGVEIS